MDSEPPFSIAESDMMDISPAQTTISTTVITNLNNDCLLEVFQHLALADLYATEDVCRLFRANARTRLAALKFENNDVRIECSNIHGHIS